MFAWWNGVYIAPPSKSFTAAPSISLSWLPTHEQTLELGLATLSLCLTISSRTYSYVKLASIMFWIGLYPALAWKRKKLWLRWQPPVVHERLSLETNAAVRYHACSCSWAYYHTVFSPDLISHTHTHTCSMNSSIERKYKTGNVS